MSVAENRLFPRPPLKIGGSNEGALLSLIAMVMVGVPLWMALMAWRFAPKGKRSNAPAA
jgi:hypothetical protein